ncbi:hypothetical protein AK812_SmicGene42586 [Symbiodinium microadriaticum]|uniref:ISXO2-like transposase domain-containing protein n=1 Tax=Symbiodinium microadriaticum TaxID=2951 RepID=A0A1Q9C354_SYMMI|nr:hypothetical protein AK812_SmicGene42586 [Symbiodinium microadriaticum]
MGKVFKQPIIHKKGKFRAAQKKPVIKKDKLWKDTPYVRDQLLVGPRGQRQDQVKWQRNLPELLMASNKKVITMLVADKILPKWKGKTCPHCEVGILSDFCVEKRTGLYKHRCSSRHCHQYVSPHHLHPVFTEGKGSASRSLQMQASLLLLKLLRVPHPTIHVLLNVNHKAIEDMEKRRTEWKTLGTKLLKDRKVVLHTDAARSYKAKIAGVIHNKVVHAKKRVKRNGKFIWQHPKYVKVVTHKIPKSNKKIVVKSGTQIIDRCWRFLKDRVKVNQHTNAGSRQLCAKLRSAQYEYWYRNEDLWLKFGELCAENMRKFLK